jgi:hypothetical protein
MNAQSSFWAGLRVRSARSVLACGNRADHPSLVVPSIPVRSKIGTAISVIRDRVIHLVRGGAPAPARPGYG